VNEHRKWPPWWSVFPLAVGGWLGHLMTRGDVWAAVVIVVASALAVVLAGRKTDAV